MPPADDAASSGADRHGPGQWVQVCPVSEVPDGVSVGHDVGQPEGERGVCLARTADGEIKGMLDRCPHRDIALGGSLIRDGRLTCRGHFWVFDLVSGQRTDLPTERLTFYPTRIEDGWVWVRVPAPAPKIGMREWLLQQTRAGRPSG